MTIAHMHPEDVKAALRKRFGSVFEFERKHNVPPKTVSEHLRGRSRRGIADLLETALSSDLSDDSAAEPNAHYPKSGAL